MNTNCILKVACFFLLGPTLALTQTMSDRSIPALVKDLGSSNSRVREAAHQSLKERPESAPALREALGSVDPEVARRAADILDHFDRVPLRELDLAISQGRIERAIELAVQMPKGKYEGAIVDAFRALVGRINDAHQKLGKDKRDEANYMSTLKICEFVPFKGQRVTEETKAEPLRRLQCYLIRADTVDVDNGRTVPEKQGNRFAVWSHAIVSAGPVRIYDGVATVIISRGPIEFSGSMACALVVSAGNVKVNGRISQSLVIARGSVECPDGASRSRIISGKLVKCDERSRGAAAITENEPNPLGFIRWSDPLKEKEKAAPKSK